MEPWRHHREATVTMPLLPPPSWFKKTRTPSGAVAHNPDSHQAEMSLQPSIVVTATNNLKQRQSYLRFERRADGHFAEGLYSGEFSGLPYVPEVGHSAVAN